MCVYFLLLSLEVFAVKMSPSIEGVTFYGGLSGPNLENIGQGPVQLKRAFWYPVVQQQRTAAAGLGGAVSSPGGEGLSP